MTLWIVAIVAIVVAGCVATVSIRSLARRRHEKMNPALRGERLRREAQQFARLVVSEIRLYNEERVSEGREHHDLYIRLRDEIERSRAIYDKRIDWLVADSDYFHKALVEILCENQAEALGQAYPGPRTLAVQ